MKVFDRLKAWIVRAGMTNKKFAAKAGTSSSHLKMILSGSRRPSPELARRIELATGRQISSYDLCFEAVLDAEQLATQQGRDEQPIMRANCDDGDAA